MRQCPTCKLVYTDETLQFCLQDGTPLQQAPGNLESPPRDYGEQETVVSGRQSNQISTPPATNPAAWNADQYQSRPTAQPPQKKSGATFAVLATALVMLILFGFVGLGAWYYLKGAANDPNANILQAKKSPTPENANRATTTQANTSKTIPAAATPATNADANRSNSAPVDAGQVREEVTQKIESWNAAAENRNFNEYMSNYAGTVDYYNKKGASLASVRADKDKAFRAYDSINFTISNMTVTPDATGETATAVFDKEWVFEGEKYSAGKVQSQLKLKRVNGQWLITSERDLKVYYTE